MVPILLSVATFHNPKSPATEGGGPSLSLPVVYQTPPPSVKSAKAVVAEFAAKLGKTVELERSLQRIPLLVEGGSLTASQQLNQLAFALHAVVLTDGKTLRIERSNTGRKELNAIHQKKIRTNISNGLEIWDRILVRAAALGDVTAQVKAAQEELARVQREAQIAEANHQSYSPPRDMMGEDMVSPAGHFLRSLVRRIGIDTLSQLSPNEVRFLSDRPNSAESPLPKCDDLRAEYSNQRDQFLSATGGTNLGAPAKLILRIDEGQLNLKVFNAAGKLVDEGWASYDMKIFLFGGPARPTSSGQAVWQPTEESAQRISAILDDGAFHLSPATLPAEYLDPEKFDPLNFAVRQGLLALQKPAGSSLLIVLSDDLLRLTDGCVKEGRLNVTEFEQTLFSRGGYEKVQRDGTLVVRPIDELVAESSLADRAVLTKGIRRILDDKAITPRNWSALFASVFVGGYQPVTERYLRPLRRLGLPEFRNLSGHSAGEFALVGATLQTNKTETSAASPPFNALLADGIRHGWLTFQSKAGTTDLDIAPSTLLASQLSAGKIGLISGEKPVLEQYGGMSEEQIAKIPFDGVDAKLIGPTNLFPGGRRPNVKIVQFRIEGSYLKPNYRIGRQILLGSNVMLSPTIQTRIELLDAICDRSGLKFDQLPPNFHDLIMETIRRQIGETEPTPKTPPTDR